jgi:hypothetical protein
MLNKLTKENMMLLHKPKLNSKGFGHVELILIIVVIVALVGVGGLVYSKHNKAHAGGWTLIAGTGASGTQYIKACHTYSANYYGFGAVNEITVQFWKPGSLQNVWYTAYNTRLNPNGIANGTSWFYGVVAQESVNQSVLLNDKISIDTGTGARGGGATYTVAQVNSWATC